MKGRQTRGWASRLFGGAVRGAVRVGVPAPRIILTYHDVGDQPGAVPEASFAAQMQRVLDVGYSFVPLTAMTAWSRGQRRLPGRAIAITFDDGLASTARVAAPILKRHDIPATVFPVLEFLDGPRRFGSVQARAILDHDDGAPDTLPWDYMTWAELDAWMEAGGEVGGHTLTHPFLGETPAPRGKEEVAACRSRLAERYGEPPAIFCYPFGDASGSASRWVREAGFQAAVTTVAGAVGLNQDPMLIPRMPAPAQAGEPFDDVLFGIFHHRQAVRRLLAGGAA
jgi:peptidoglycan/xylan/chitin deacetylase (PgdA/CDA1 family)